MSDTQKSACNVAVLEDNDELRELVTDILGERGYAVRAFSSLAAATAALSQDPPQLFISDVELPDGCGLDLVASLRDSTGNRVPAIVLSARRDEGDFVRGFAAGAVDYVGKPFTRDELLARCAMQLARVRAQTFVPSSRDSLPERNGLVFGRYRVVKELGRGGYGRVFLAHDRARADELVALKVLDPMAGGAEESRLRFVRETYAAASVRHPRVAALHDSGTMDHRSYYAMEYVPGISLQSHVKKNGKLNESEARDLARGLLEALAAVGGAGLLHRDLKPENVILRNGCVGDPVLIDFGLAKSPFDRGLTEANVLIGTLAYLTPEAIRGQPIDARSDLFALGLTVRFALAGEEIFPELTGVDVLAAIAHREIPLPSGDLSRDFGRFLSTLTANAPDNRPADARAALDLLAR